MAQSRSIYVGNLPSGISKDKLIALCTDFGTVVNAHLVFDKFTGKFKHFGFVHFTGISGAERAIRTLHKSSLDGNVLAVRYADFGYVQPTTQKPSLDEALPAPPPGHSKHRASSSPYYASSATDEDKDRRAPAQVTSEPAQPTPATSATPSKRPRDPTDAPDVEVVLLPSVEKKRRLMDTDKLVQLKKSLATVIEATKEAPAKLAVGAPLSPDMVAALKAWARPDYVLMYKEKTKPVDDVPGDIRHEGRDIRVYTLKVYW